jgi:hypothetical protein
VPREATVPRKRGLQAALRARPETPAGSAPPPRGDRHPAVICQPRRRGAHSPRVLRDGFARQQDSRGTLEDITRNARISSWPTAAPGSPARDAATRSGRSSAGRVLQGPSTGAAAAEQLVETLAALPALGRMWGMAAGGIDGAGGGGWGLRCGSGRGRAGPGGSRAGGEPGRGASRAGGRAGQEERSGRRSGRAGRAVGQGGESARWGWPPDVKRAKARHIAAAECR